MIRLIYLKLYLKLNFPKDIPIGIIFKGLGIVSDQEIVQLVGLEEEIMEALIPCIYETHSHQVYTQLQVSHDFVKKKLYWKNSCYNLNKKALSYIGNKVKSPSIRKGGEDYRKNKSKEQEGRDLLVKIILAHVPVDIFDL